MKITEDNVVEQIKYRNEQAISFIINQYGGLLSAIIKRYINYNEQDYEECFDDVLLAIWNNIDFYDESKNSFKQWVAAIAKYQAIDYLRKYILMKNRQYSVGDLNDSMFPVEAKTNLISDINELLKSLSPKEQEIFRKYYIEGFPTKEIAKKYDRREHWVHNILSRGRKKLRKFAVKEDTL